MLDLLRDSPFGLTVNYLSKGKILPFADQRPDYVIPSRYLPGGGHRPSTSTPPTPPSGLSTPNNNADASTLVNAEGVTKDKSSAELEKGVSPPSPEPPVAKEAPHPYLVDWEENDQDNPRNWSQGKRLFVAGEIMLLTFSVYIGSAIYTSAIPSIEETFHVSGVVATLGLSLFVLFYGFGPMLFSPIQELPKIGRMVPYYIGLFLFVLFQVPPIMAESHGGIASILVFRAAAGFVGSPALATGGASMGDLFPMEVQAYAISAWAIGAVLGPVTGPVIGGFAAQANGFRWPFYELLWISGFALLVFTFLMPETLGDTILVRRAQRLRKLTGNMQLKTASELEAKEGATFAHDLARVIKMAFRLSVEPAILFSNLYIGIVYAVFYLWFECFAIVFNETYGFSLGIGGLPYLSFIVSGVFTLGFYVLYLKFHLMPRYAKNPNLMPEARLELAIGAGLLIPASLFIFGWSAGRGHWMGPIVGAALYLPGIFLIFQSVIMYIAMSYPKYMASLFAGNALFRSTLASVFPLFGRYFYDALTVAGGCSLLAGVSLIMVPVMFALFKYGGHLRSRSKFTGF
ncbi:putative caffeine resistance protein [Meredithblackwellia eburnea MCA 4105]